MNFKYPFSAIGHHLEDEVFDILKDANKTMKTYAGYYQEKFEKEFSGKFQYLLLLPFQMQLAD